jgi:hypothetical protein
MYQVWWLMPAQTMSTSVTVGRPALAFGAQDDLGDLPVAALTPWHRPMVSTPP